MNQDELVQQLIAAVTDGDDSAAARLAQQAMAAGVPPMALVKTAIQPAMDVVGSRFECGEAFLPELILAGDAARAALDQIMPQVSEKDQATARTGTVVIATMFGDNHDIGKNIVSAILSTYGFKVVDLGINASPPAVVEAATKAGADIIACSTLITTSLPYQRQIIDILKETGRRDKHFVVVGGGPVTPEWAKSVGADGYGRDANDAATLCQQLMDGPRPPLADPIVVGALKKH
jgi:methylmalonyl-CoA mutase cobalamin-binding domain/chain